MKEQTGRDNLAIAWRYSGREHLPLEVIPARHLRMTRPATCLSVPGCGATLETWTGISGTSIADLMSGTINLAIPPNRAERLGSLLEAPVNTDDNYGSRMKGWLMPPVSGEYAFWIAADDQGELWLSSDDHPENKIRVCFVPEATLVREWYKSPDQQSTSIPLEAGGAYYFEVSPAIIFAALHFACSKPLHKLSFVVCTINNALSIVRIFNFLFHLLLMIMVFIKR